MIYLVEGDPGTLVSVGLDAIREVDRCPRVTADFRLVILDSRGEEIGEAWPGNRGCRAYGPWEFPRDGRMAILIRSGDGLIGEEEEPPKTGSFALTIGAPNGRTEETSLGLDESTTVEGRIAIPLDFVDYQVRGEPGDLVSVAVVSLNDIAECGREVWDLYLTALDTDGSEFGSGWPANEGCKAYGGWEIPAAGVLVIRVQGGTGAIAPMTGKYWLDIGRYRYDTVAVDTRQGPQRFGGTVEIVLDGTVYEIEAPAGSRLSVDVVSMNNQVDCGGEVLDLILFVSDSDGEVIAEEWPGNSGCRSFGPWTVPESGTLVVLARGNDFWGFPATGTYELEFSTE